MASPCSALTRCVVPLSLSFLLHPSLPHLGKSLTDLSDTPLFSSVVRDAGVLGIKAQLSLLADHETTASSCMGPVGLRQESVVVWKGILYPGEARVVPVPKGKMFQRNLLENCNKHSPACCSCSASIVKESPDTPHHKQNGVLEKNTPDPLQPSFEMTSPNNCFLQLYLMFNFCLSIGLSLSYQVANHCWADWNQICNDGAGRARSLPRR